MKTFKKVLALAVSLVMVFSAFAAVMSVSASAAESDVAYKLSAIGRHYGWGQWAKQITYTSNGWMKIKDEGRFTQMYQTAFVPTKSEKSKIESAMKSAIQNYKGLLACDVTINSYATSNANQIDSNDEAKTNGVVSCQVLIGYKYTDKGAIDNDIDEDTGKPINPEGWVYGSFAGTGWGKYDTPYTLDIAVDDYAQFIKGLPEYDEDYGNFEIENIIIQAMNFSTNATESAMEFNGKTFPKGTKGLGYIDIDFSPVYIKGTTCPAKGTDLGEDVEFIANSEDASAAGTFKFISAKKEVPQSSDPSQHDGPYGSRADIDRDQLVTAVYGDADGDGKLNMKDVLLMRKHIAGYKVEINKDNSDIDSDGKINMKDVLLLRKHIAGYKVAPWN